MPNRLASESSPYLKQHAHNPVDWYPWGDEAFEKARREDKPVFLSIGYSSCHWCHVMERESFENEDVARLLNESWVSIKVDREERPDVDDVYMTAVQLTTGRGGWPLSSFLLPDGRPFFGGTYFPPDDRHGRTGFRTLLTRLAEAWKTRRSEVEQSAAELAREIAGSSEMTARGPAVALSRETLPNLTRALERAFDDHRGGFGGAPKFPPHLALEWLLLKGVEGDPDALSMATVTLDAMALGGIHDHLGGGFHRYSTDAEWLVPHFEKMLTDNAQLLGVYARAFAATGDAFYASVARDTGDYLLREMRGGEGGLFAATDADSEGEEGKFFVWEAKGILEILGEKNGRFFCEWYRARESGNFNEEASGRPTGVNILHLSKKPPAEAEERLAPMRERLLAVRSHRVPPALDDKRVAGWNALAISGFAIASRALSEPRYLEAARTCARFVLGSMRDDSGRLLRTWKDGAAKIPAFLEDQAYFANALLDLSEAEEGDAAAGWLAEARKVVDGMRRRFGRKDGPGFTFAGEGNEELLMKGRDLFDKAIPSGSGAATRALVRVARRTGDAALVKEARAALEEVSWLMSRSPHGMESWHLALAELLEVEAELEKGPKRDLSSMVNTERTGPGKGFSSNVNEAESSAEARSADGVLAVSYPSEHRAKRGTPSRFVLTLQIADGWHLQGPDGLRIEAWGGSDIPFEEIFVPAPSPMSALPPDPRGDPVTGWHGVISANISFFVSASASPGARNASVIVRYRACGDGACRPEAALSVSIPVDVLR